MIRILLTVHPPREYGIWAEELVADYLLAKGMRPISKNYRCKFGEIDLIMRQDSTVVFVEVRFRRNSHFGTGVQSVDSRKKRRIVMTARHYLQQNPLLRDRPCRFDIVSVSSPNPSSDRYDNVQWIPAAFEA